MGALPLAVVNELRDLRAAEADSCQPSLRVVAELPGDAILDQIAGRIAGYRLCADGGEPVACAAVV